MRFDRHYMVVLLIICSRGHCGRCSGLLMLQMLHCRCDIESEKFPVLAKLAVFGV